MVHPESIIKVNPAKTNTEKHVVLVSHLLIEKGWFIAMGLSTVNECNGLFEMFFVRVFVSSAHSFSQKKTAGSSETSSFKK